MATKLDRLVTFMKESGFTCLSETELKAAFDGLSDHLIQRSEVAISDMPKDGKRGDPETELGLRCSAEHLAYQELVYAFICLLEMADLLEATGMAGPDIEVVTDGDVGPN